MEEVETCSLCLSMIKAHRARGQKGKQTETYSSAGSGAAAAAAEALSPGGGCSVGTAFEDLAGVDVGDTLFVGDPWIIDREAPFLAYAPH